jgi:hypothetical protein
MSNLNELLERFRRGPELLAVVLTGLGLEEPDFVPAPGKWSIRQIIAHVADTELVMAQRFRQIAAEDNPTVVAYDQEAWARGLDYARRKPAQSLDTFRRLRSENYELLKGLPETAFARTGNHTARGPVTLQFLVELAATHSEKHAQQLQGLREQFKRSRASA